MTKIEPVYPVFGINSYRNPESQGALHCLTANWPNETPEGWAFGSSYHDRMRQWDYDKYRQAQEAAGFRGDSLPQDATDEQLLALCRTYFDKYDIQAVRVIYYFNVSSGYDTPRIDYIYRVKK